MVNNNRQEIALMATKKAKPKARSSRKATLKGRLSSSKAVHNLGKYMDEIKIGNYTWDDVLKSTGKNLEAVADANRAIIDGYSDIARRQYEMLKGLLRELRKVRGDRDEVVRELKRVIERARKDVKALQKMASSTNSKAQRIVKRRAEANLKAWKLLVAEARKSVSGTAAAVAQPVAAMKAAPKRKAAAKKKKAAPRKAAAAKKKAAPKKKTAAKRKAAPKRKTARR